MTLAAQDESLEPQKVVPGRGEAVLSWHPYMRVGFLALLGMVAITFGWPGCLPIVNASPRLSTCVGDCDQDGAVTVDEIVLLVNIVLGATPLSSCPTLTMPPDVTDVVGAIDAALKGCPPIATLTATATQFPTPTPVVFRAGEGSSIVYSEGDGSSPVEEPLSGTFAFRLVGNELHFLIFDVSEVELASRSFNVSGESGAVRMGVSCDSLAFLELHVVINGDDEFLFGVGEIASCPPDIATIASFQVCSITPRQSDCETIRTGSLKRVCLARGEQHDSCG